jgi:hypothetical protein
MVFSIILLGFVLVVLLVLLGISLIAAKHISKIR